MADPTYSARSDALKTWMEGGEGKSREREKSPSLVKTLLPLALAQALDMISTEGFLNASKDPSASLRTDEANPLPGMGSTPGRMAWQGGELLVAALLNKIKPGMTKKYVSMMVPPKVDLALTNTDLTDLIKSSRGQGMSPGTPRFRTR